MPFIEITRALSGEVMSVNLHYIKTIMKTKMYRAEGTVLTIQGANGSFDYECTELYDEVLRRIDYAEKCPFNMLPVNNI
jgi:hypothetical protein